MLRIDANYLNFSRSTGTGIALATVWSFGLVLGNSLCKPYYFPLMRCAFREPASIVGLFICIFLPFILSYFFILLDKPILVLIVCFIKSIAYGFSSGLISLLFYEASWLFRFLFLFSDSCFLLVLLFFWLKYFPGRRKFHRGTLLLFIVIGLVISIVDYSIISQLLEGLL